MIPERIAATIDPVFAQWLRDTHVELPDGFVPSTEQMRAAFAQMAAAVDSPIHTSINIVDQTVPGRTGHNIPVRVYRNEGADSAAPVCVFIHGGGWVLGNLDTHNSLCADIARQAKVTVVAVDYRLSPEHQFPAALHDCEDVVLHVVNNADELNIDQSRMAVLGDSAGANLATACCISLLDRNVQFKTQVLVYPALGASMDAPSYTENADVPGLSVEDMAFYFRAYNGGDVPKGPLAAPLQLSDVGAQPNTFISVAEFDPLRDDGTQYASKLEKAGVNVTLRTENGLGHSYLWLRHSSVVAREAFAAQTAFLKDQLA